MKKDNIIIFIISLILTIIVLLVFKDVSEVPIHYNLKGEVDQYGSKFILVGLSFLPFLISVLMDFLKKVDPNTKNYDLFIKYYNGLKYLIVAFLNLLIIGIIISDVVFINIGTYTGVLVGILFILIGLILPNIKQNYFVGIKTPWTLKDENTWNITHKRGKYVFILMGIIFFIIAFLKIEVVLILGIILVIALIVYLFYYSYEIYNNNNN